jgi:hypothetical protein
VPRCCWWSWGPSQGFTLTGPLHTLLSSLTHLVPLLPTSFPFSSPAEGREKPTPSSTVELVSIYDDFLSHPIVLFQSRADYSHLTAGCRPGKPAYTLPLLRFHLQDDLTFCSERIYLPASLHSEYRLLQRFSHGAYRSVCAHYQLAPERRHPSNLPYTFVDLHFTYRWL